MQPEVIVPSIVMVTLIFLVLSIDLCSTATATVYIKMKKPNAAIRDANAALEVLLCPYLTLILSFNITICVNKNSFWVERSQSLFVCVFDD